MSILYMAILLLFTWQLNTKIVLHLIHSFFVIYAYLLNVFAIFSDFDDVTKNKGF